MQKKIQILNSKQLKQLTGGIQDPGSHPHHKDNKTFSLFVSKTVRFGGGNSSGTVLA